MNARHRFQIKTKALKENRDFNTQILEEKKKTTETESGECAQFRKTVALNRFILLHIRLFRFSAWRLVTNHVSDSLHLPLSNRSVFM